MRIAVINHNRTIAGGKEIYLRQLLPALASRGHEVAFWHEDTVVAGHEVVTLPEGAPSWSVAGLGAQRALDALRQWQPKVIYAHGLGSPELEAETQKIAPSVFFAHDYYGCCVSGSKTFSLPQPQPCDRSFGWQCLVHYYPRRCGGLSPGTMLRDYGLQKKRLALLRDYGAVLVASTHMAREYQKYGLDTDRVTVVRLPVSVEGDFDYSKNDHQPRPNWRILFLSRMESLKGGAVLLESLPAVARASALPLHVTFAGDGRRRKEWEQRASQLASANPGLEFSFPGWLDEPQRSQALRECDLMVMPSLWPEPFGLAGPEAGLSGVPVVAFAVGGIPDWLKHGVNGMLAPGDPPSAKELAAVILGCLSDEDFFQQLRRGAMEQAQRFNIEDHITSLIEIFQRVCGGNHRGTEDTE
jgi:glycosyltransferase involved in cell wall biosynthesis